MTGEHWRSIPGFPGYEASTEGRVRSWRSRCDCSLGSKKALPRIITGALDKCSGYRITSLRDASGKWVCTRIHRLICLAFHGPCPVDCECRVIDGDRGNLRPENLKWATVAERMGDARVRRRISFGHPKTIPDAVVAQIRRLYRSGLPITNIQEQLPMYVDRRKLCSLAIGDGRKSCIEPPCEPRGMGAKPAGWKNHLTKYPDEIVERCIHRYLGGQSVFEIAQAERVRESAVRRWVSGQNRADVAPNLRELLSGEAR